MVFYPLGCKPPGYHKWQTMFGFWGFFETVRIYRFTISKFVWAWVRKKYTCRAFYFKNIKPSKLSQTFHTNVLGTLKSPSPGFCSRSFCPVKSKDCEIMQSLNLIEFFLKKRTLD